MNLSDHFVTCIKRWYGKEGEDWLKNLQNHIDSCAKKWDLDIGEAMPNLSVNYVANAKLSDGTEIILKMSPHKKPIMEMEALEHLTNHPGIVNLLYADEELAAMVIEKVNPGTSLREVQAKNDEEAIRIAAPIIRDVQADVPSTHHLRTVRKEMEVIKEMHDKGGWDTETMAMLHRALNIFDELESTKSGDKLIHGDLHHDNILFDENRGWLAIDPKGRIGDPIYNAARIMRNYWDTTPTEALARKRIAILAEVMECQQKRIVAWSYMDCVLSESWDLDEIGKRGEDEKPIIEILEALL
jgi:streptomycin 6-kinase